MNLNYILRQFKRINTLETFVSYKFLSQYYNTKPSKHNLKKELSNMRNNNDNKSIDDEIVGSIISNNQLSDKIKEKIIQHRQYVDKELLQSPKQIINYRLERLNEQRITLKKSNSNSNIDDIKSKRLSLSRSWYNNIAKVRARTKQKPVIIPNEECTNMNKSVRQCLSTQIRETTLEDHKKMIDYLEKSLKKELVFVAETTPKVTLGEFFTKKNSTEVYDRHVKSKPRFNENNKNKSNLSIIPSSTSNNNKILSPLSMRTPNKVIRNKELYQEIKRSEIDPSQSYLINKPLIPLIQAKAFSQIKHTKHKSPEKDKKQNAFDLIRINKEKIRHTIIKREKLLFIIRPEKSG